jgi:hypothetical protein
MQFHPHPSQFPSLREIERWVNAPGQRVLKLWVFGQMLIRVKDVRYFASAVRQLVE